MKRYIQKYWRTALYYAVLLVIALFFTSNDYAHYLRCDHHSFYTGVNWVLGVFFGVMLILLIIASIRGPAPFGDAIASVAGLIAYAIFIIFFAGKALTNVALLINRQYHGAIVNRQFTIYRDTTYPFITIQTADKEEAKDLEDHYQLPNHTPGKQVDTIYIPFTKGLFGMPYIDK